MYPRRFSVTFAGVTGVAVSAMGQCTPSWSGYAGPMLDNGVYAVTSWDPDGPGPALPVVVAGGNFEHIGASPLSFVGRWDGGAWLPMGPGVSGTVLCATVWDPDGFGPDPARPFIGGFFSQSAGTTLNCIGWFDGAGWQPLGSGFGGVPVNAVTLIIRQDVKGGVRRQASGVRPRCRALAGRALTPSHKRIRRRVPGVRSRFPAWPVVN